MTKFLQTIVANDSQVVKTPQLHVVMKNAHATGRIIRVVWGDTVTGQSWGEENDCTGRIGLSTGREPTLLLVPDGEDGGAGFVANIVRVCGKSGQVLWEHPEYKPKYDWNNMEVRWRHVNRQRGWMWTLNEKGASDYIAGESTHAGIMRYWKGIAKYEIPQGHQHVGPQLKHTKRGHYDDKCPILSVTGSLPIGGKLPVKSVTRLDWFRWATMLENHAVIITTYALPFTVVAGSQLGYEKKVEAASAVYHAGQEY